MVGDVNGDCGDDDGGFVAVVGYHAHDVAACWKM